MRRLLAVSATIAMVAMAAAPPGSAQAPPQDGVSGDGVISFTPGSGSWTEARVDARSGPSGETPSGTVSLQLCVGVSRSCFQSGEVTCLSVTGNRAVVGWYGGIFSPAGGPPVRLRGLVEIEDNGSPGAGRDTLQIEFDYIYLGGPVPPPDVPITTCPASLPGDGLVLFAGDTSPYNFPQNYVVTDAKPLPTTKDQCKNGEWRTYGGLQEPGRLRQLRSDRWQEPTREERRLDGAAAAPLDSAARRV